MVSRDESIEVPYGWVVIFVSLALHSIALGAPNVLFILLKPIATDLGSLRSVPSFAYSLLMIGAGVGGLAMGFWMDKRGYCSTGAFRLCYDRVRRNCGQPIGEPLGLICRERTTNWTFRESGDGRAAC
tara:strand:+ start:5237 stop:5620 length:384 start_codon:yes stop_codon:yes gene_type:complete